MNFLRFRTQSTVVLSLLILSTLSAPMVRASHATRPDVVVDWSTFGYDIQCTGYNPNETVLGVNNAGSLHQVWSQDLGWIMNTQPMVAHAVNVNGNSIDLVYAGTEHGDFYALNAATGQIVWQRDLGYEHTRCYDYPNMDFGITDAGTIDRNTNRIYVVGGDGQAYALDLVTGATASGWPAPVTLDPHHEHVYGGLNLFRNVLYVAISSNCDITPYHGRIVAVDVTRPQRRRAWFPAGTTFNGGGIWGWGGVSIDPVDGNVYTATGNALANREYYRFSEHIVRLTPALVPVAANFPGFTGFDVDFGATPTLFQAPGCPQQLAAKNKVGIMYIYNTDTINDGPVQSLQIGRVGDRFFLGLPSYLPVANLLYVPNSSNSQNYVHGMVALQLQPDCTWALAWQTQAGPNNATTSPASVANGVVYYGDGTGSQLHAFNALTGQELWNSGSLITGYIYAAPTVVNGRLYDGAWDHVLRAFAP